MSTALTVTLVVGAGFLALAVAIAHSLAADEIRAWLPYLARRLARSAARRLPAESRARYEADWLAELTAWQDRPLSALAKAAHIRWKAKAIRESLGGVQLKGEGVKRAFDLLSAIGLLIFFSPLLLATAIVIKLDSRGPVFVRQPRAGRGSESFGLIKFRSMYVDADQRLEEIRQLNQGSDGVMFKIRADPRVTRVGRFSRRYSLDELPQLFNILKGDMSLVGPRPLPTRDGASKGEQDLDHTEVRPGLTGIAQIRFFTSEHRTLKEVAEANDEYARSRSFFMDIKLLFQTFWTVLGASILRRFR